MRMILMFCIRSKHHKKRDETVLKKILCHFPVANVSDAYRKHTRCQQVK